MASTEQLIVGLYDRGAGTQNKILDIGNPKILKSGIWSPYLVNFRPVLSFDTSSEMNLGDQSDLRDDLIDSYCDALNDYELNEGESRFLHVYGAPEAGTPLASAVAQEAGLSLLWSRVGGEKSYGSHQKLEGTFRAGENAVVIDDVITNAATKIESRALLTAAGLEVTDVVVGFDRQQGGREEVEAAGMHLTAAITALSAFEALLENRRITETEHDFLKQYTLNPPVYEEPADHPWKTAS